VEALRARVREVLAGFWAVPLATSVALAALAFVLVAIDDRAGAKGVSLGFHADAAAARDILSVVAGSLITVAGLTFSLLVVTLQLVSGQFTPRAMRRILADRTTQVVAGVFVGVVAYALIVLRSVRAVDASDALVPSLATTVAIWLALIALGLLIVFIHHIGTSIQVSTITARVARETLQTVDRLCPDDGRPPLDTSAVAEVASSWRAEGAPVIAHPPRPGYVQVVGVHDVAAELPPGARAVVTVRTGDFVTEETAAIEIWSAEATSETVARVAGAIVVADERDLRSDVAFGIRQLVDIALRAISPGINDPTSATTSIGYLTAILERLAGRPYPKGRAAEDDRLVVSQTPAFSEHLETGFAELGRYADDTRVASSLLDALGSIGEAAHRAGAVQRAEAVATMATRIGERAIGSAGTGYEADELRRRLTRATARCGSVT
jgi:uncharacterized membrane protein